MIIMKKNIVKIYGYCSKWVEGDGWVTEVPVSVLESMGFVREKQEEEPKLLGYCECCGLPIYERDIYTKIDGTYYCDYCGGEDGMAISEGEEL